jgi:hypothetical protein
MIKNFRGSGRSYVKGYVRVSHAATLRLSEIGVSLSLSRGHGYESFFIPDECADEFVHIPGNPGVAGWLSLASEEAK